MSETGYVLKISKHGVIRREAFKPDDSLKQLQEAVGGYIERVDIPAFELHGLNCDCYVNEEGLFDPDPVLNIAVSQMAHRRIEGDAVLAMHDGAGNTYGIPDHLCMKLATYAKDCFAIGVLFTIREVPKWTYGVRNEQDQKQG